MELTNKYYTPSIEEFRLGFEYEQFIQTYKVLGEPKQEGDGWSYPVEHLDNRWEKVKYHLDDFLEVDMLGEYEFEPIDPTLVRVKYLDREDVESIFKEMGREIIDDGGGWSKEYLDNLEWYVECVGKKFGEDLFISKKKDDTITIEQDETFRFEGTIKNKSELKVLLKQMGVNE
jgi:hypothetical protein